jgi:cytochrome c biogenesis protein CcdA/thiol-disulfide isomerase/thioredoxin
MFLLLLGIGFVAGVVTAVSPCVLPVLPILLAGGAAGGRRRPFAIVGGLVVSFSVFTLFAAWILDQLGLPKDLLRNVAIALLFVIAASLIVPQIGALIERPFQRLGAIGSAAGQSQAARPATRANWHAPTGDLGGGFLLGVSLGLVFVPCAGPVLTAITVESATLHFGWRTILLTIAYALGAAVPMLIVAAGGQRFLRPRAQRVRTVLGVVVALATLAIVFHVDNKLQTALSDYTNVLQKPVEKSAFASKQLGKLTGSGQGAARAATAKAKPGGSLPDFGPAPDFAGIDEWLNSRRLTIGQLRGKVVLIDFWTYSCINCLRTLPHDEAWDRLYRKDGLVIVGVHTPEFTFESVPSNVRAATKRLGVRYPVALDSRYGTWTAYGNQYWPAKYLIDRQGNVRYAHFGEGNYDVTERNIRKLLGETPGAPASSQLADMTPTEPLTPESYLGSERLARYAGSPLHEGKAADYTFPATLGQNQLAYSGRLRLDPQRIVAVQDARLRLHFHAQKVFLVLGGKGTVQVLVNGLPDRTIRVTADRLYTLVDGTRTRDALLELRFSSGIEAYAFTFG